MNTRFDPYAILGVRPEATQAQLNHAYRALVRRYHPDTRGVQDPSLREVADTALQQVLAAYAVLGDPGRRAEYDTRSSRPSSGPAPATPHRGTVPFSTRVPAPEPAIRVGPVRWHPHRNT